MVQPFERTSTCALTSPLSLSLPRQVITCSNCEKGFHTFCVGEKRIPYALFPPEQRDQRDAFIAENFGARWQCSKCQTQAAQATTSPLRATHSSYPPAYREFGSGSSSTSKRRLSGGGRSGPSLSRNTSVDSESELVDISPVKGVAPSSAPMPVPKLLRTAVNFSVEPSSAPLPFSRKSGRFGRSRSTDGGGSGPLKTNRFLSTRSDDGGLLKTSRHRSTRSDDGLGAGVVPVVVDGETGRRKEEDVVDGVKAEGGVEKEAESGQAGVSGGEASGADADADAADGAESTRSSVEREKMDGEQERLEREREPRQDPPATAEAEAEEEGLTVDASESRLFAAFSPSSPPPSPSAAAPVSKGGSGLTAVDGMGALESAEAESGGKVDAENQDGKFEREGKRHAEDGGIEAGEDGEEAQGRRQEEVPGGVVEIEEVGVENSEEALVNVSPEPDSPAERTEELAELAWRLGLSAVATLYSCPSEAPTSGGTSADQELEDETTAAVGGDNEELAEGLIQLRPGEALAGSEGHTGEKSAASLPEVLEPEEGLEEARADAGKPDERGPGEGCEEPTAEVVEASRFEGLEEEVVIEGATYYTTQEDTPPESEDRVFGEGAVASPAPASGSEALQEETCAAAADGEDDAREESFASAEEALEPADRPVSIPEELAASIGVEEEEGSQGFVQPVEVNDAADDVNPGEDGSGSEVGIFAETTTVAADEVEPEDVASGDGSCDVADPSASAPADDEASVSPSRQPPHETEEEEQAVAARLARGSRSNTPSPRTPTVALFPTHESEKEQQHAKEPERGALLLDFPRSPPSSPGGGGGRGGGGPGAAGPASSLPTQESPPSSPRLIDPFSDSSPSRTMPPRSPSSPHRTGFAASSPASTLTARSRSPPKSPRRHPPLGPTSPDRHVLETSQGPAWSSPSRPPTRSPRRKTVAGIDQTAPLDLQQQQQQQQQPGSGKQTPRGREGRASRRESPGSRTSARRSASSSVAIRPWGLSSQEPLGDGEDGGGGGGASGAGGKGGGRRSSAGSALSVGSNAADDGSVAPGGGSAAAGGKPKLRRVESLNNLKGEGEEFGGLSGRARSYTTVDGDTDALGQDLAAVVNHLKEVRWSRKMFPDDWFGVVGTKYVLSQA